ncbi:MAG: ABC transporter permease [Erysipelotrichaceae bacterium]|nr:ABC transporter permease [Erysipelotrichaceae bacterium]
MSSNETVIVEKPNNVSPPPSNEENGETTAKRTPFYQKSWFQSIFSSVIAVVIGLILGLIIMIATRPDVAFSKFPILLGQWITTTGRRGLGRWLELVPPLLMCGLGVGLSFKAGLFNIGASGQYTVGLFFAYLVGMFGGPLGNFQWIVAILAGALGGLIWGFFPGFFKATFRINEVITSIMFNYIGMYMVDSVIVNSASLYNSARGRAQTINLNAMTNTLGLEKVFPGSNVDATFFIAIATAIIMWIIISKTTFGFELKAAGANRDASRYSGINEKKSIILTMAISGLLCGLGGAFFILKKDSVGTGIEYLPDNVIQSAGFNGIVVALLGNSHPIGTIFSTFFITFLNRGGYYIQPEFKEELANIIIAVIIYFSAFSAQIGNYVIGFRKRRQRKKAIRLAIETGDGDFESDLPDVEESEASDYFDEGGSK